MGFTMTAEQMRKYLASKGFSIEETLRKERCGKFFRMQDSPLQMPRNGLERNSAL